MNTNIIKKTLLLALVCLVGFMTSAIAQGKKYALFVGINAYQGAPLKGCVNDAKNLQRALASQYGFPVENTTLLTDYDATRNGILSNLKTYQDKAQAGDIFVFTYSGHGTLFPDSRSEEQDESDTVSMEGFYPADKYDSAICPIDLRDTSSSRPWRNLILDDELFEIFSGFTDKGAMVIFLSDSCHSGTLARSFGSTALQPPKTANARFLPYSKVVNLQGIPKPTKQRKVQRRSSDANGLLIVLSGSKDNEFSLDYPDSATGTTNGLFTKTLLMTINKLSSQGQKASYMTVRDIVSPEVSRLSAIQQNSQTPQIDARFFTGKLDTPLFEFVEKAPAPNPIPTPNPTPNPTPTPVEGLLRVVVKVTDKQDNPVDGAAVGIFNQSVGRSLQAGDVSKIPSRDIRATARTNNKGIYDSNIQSLLIPKGIYFIKIVRDGYAPYIGEIKIEENVPGYCVLVVKLDKQ